MSSLSAAKKRGADWEIALTEHLRARTGQQVERIRLAGRDDRGDCHLLIATGGVAIEAKNAKTIDLAGWCREAEHEAVNAGLPGWVVAIRRRGTTNPGNGYVVVTVDEWLRQTGATP